jgi:alpha-N-acetylglucosamine transferase
MKAFITYVCNDAYIPGVIALYNSLRFSGNFSEFVVMATEEVSRNLLPKDVKVVLCDRIDYQGKNDNTIGSRYGKNKQYWKTFTKLNIWNQDNYEKLVYLDADTLVLKNIEDLFEYEEISAVYGGSKVLNSLGIESGVMVITPNKDTFEKMITHLNSDTYSIIQTDQSFLQGFFSDHGKITHLPETYNRLWKLNKDFKSCHVYHFNANKPWLNPKSIDTKSLNLWKYFYEKNYS